MVTIDKLSFSYNRKSKLIEDFTMNLERGTVCGLLGRNGSGKTTLIYLICGLLKPQGGSVSFTDESGQIFTPFSRKTGFLEDVFLIPEEFSLPSMPLESFVRVNSPFYPRFDMERFEHFLDIFEMGRDIHLGRLSMGQKKKVFLSFAMACNTSLLVMDEPTNGLDITAKRCFRRAVSECMTDDKCILISTHQVYDIDKILDHVMIIDRKGVKLDASMSEIMQRYKFSFTTDRARAESALISIDVPGGMNIVEPLTDPSEETEVNLETLYELIQSTNKFQEV